MRVLLTGNTGFLGSQVVGELESRGHEVTGLSRSGGDGIACDLTDAEATVQALSGIDPEAVVHLAGISSAAECERDPATAFEANTRATWNLLEAVAAGEGGPRIVFGSSAAVYGSRQGVLDESLAPEPSTTYGASKAAAEVLAGQYGRWAGVPVAWTRLFNLTGAGMPPGSLPGQLAARIAAAEAGGEEEIGVEIRNPGHRRDFLDVRDAARAVALVLESDLEGPVNVCSGEGLGVLEVVEVFRGLTAVRIEEVAGDASGRRQEPESPEVVGSARKLVRQIGWEPKIGLSESLGAGLESFRRAAAG